MARIGRGHPQSTRIVRLTGPYDPRTLLTGLRAWWKLEEASGQRNDSHGNALHLTDNGGVGSAAGRVGNGALIDWTPNSEYLSRSTESALEATGGAWTIHTWVKLADASQEQWIVIKGTISGGASEEYRLINWGGSGMRFLYGTYDVFGSALSNDTLALVIAWYDPGTDKVYVQVNNGTPAEATGGTLPSATAGAFWISGFKGPDPGVVDELGMWARVLTATDREWLWNGGAGRTYEDFALAGALTEAATAADSPAAQADFVADRTEAVTADATQDGGLLLTADRTETVTAGDSQSADVVLGGDLTETVTADASQVSQADMVADRTEAVSAADAPTAQADFVAARTESLAADGTQVATATFTADRTEAVTADGTQVAQAEFVAAITEAVTAGESSDATVTSSSGGDVQESVTAGAAPTAQADFVADRAEAAAAADAQAATADLVAALVEAAAAAAGQDAVLVTSAAVLESVAAGESSSYAPPPVLPPHLRLRVSPHPEFRVRNESKFTSPKGPEFRI